MVSLNELKSNPFLIEYTRDENSKCNEDTGQIYIFESTVHPECLIVGELTVYSSELKNCPIRGIPKIFGIVKIENKRLLCSFNILIVIEGGHEKVVSGIEANLKAIINEIAI